MLDCKGVAALEGGLTPRRGSVYTKTMAIAPTKILPVRVTATQSALLKTPKYKGKASAIVRVLLALYLNGRLAVHDVEALVEADYKKALIASNREDVVRK